jgi:hypothetical protein
LIDAGDNLVGSFNKNTRLISLTVTGKAVTVET